jgi:hypothetical protein
MAVQVEMWQPTIKEELFDSNAFLRYLTNRDDMVIGGKIIHIPQSGGPAGVEKNRAVVPAAVVKRNDNDLTEALDEYTTDPTYISHAETVELSYSKRLSVIRENTGKLMEHVGDDTLYKLARNAAAGNLLAATGANAQATAPGATGGRATITGDDVLRARTVLNKQKVPMRGRYMILDSDSMQALMQDEKLKYAFQQVINLQEGTCGRLYGFNLIERSLVLRLDSTLAAKDPTQANATTDMSAGLFWQQDFLERYLGDVTMYDNYGRAEYYGDIFSFLIRMGARANRSDNKGYGILYRASA